MKYSDKNKPLVCMMKDSTCYKGTYVFKPMGVLWHCTGANNPNLWRYVQPSNNDPKRDELLKKLGVNKYGSDWNHTYVSAGVNAWIGKLADGSVTTVQALPWNYAPWGCGGGAKGSCNKTHIQFEMCEDALTDRTYFDKCYKEGVELTAYLCKMYGIDPEGTVRVGSAIVPTILCHYDAYKLGVGTGHYDIYNWFDKFGKTMDDVRSDVAKLMDETGQPKSDPVNSIGMYYRAHCQSYGWLPSVHDGMVAGTVGEAKRLEALKMTPPDGMELEVDVHIQGTGWKTYKGIKKGTSSGTGSTTNDPIMGTVGKSKRLEAVRIRMVKNPKGYKVHLQAHCQSYGWMSAVGENDVCGTTGMSKRLEAIRIWFTK